MKLTQTTAIPSNSAGSSSDLADRFGDTTGKQCPVGVRIKGLRVHFDQRAAILDDLDLDILPGEIIALVGASGCGKSTLLRTIAGLQAYQAGSIDYPRMEAVGSNSAQVQQANLDDTSEPIDKAFVFQDATLLPWRTVFENVRLPFELNGHRHLMLTHSEIDQRVQSALHAVSLLEPQWKLFPRQLSGGMRMRTSIARALVTDPSLILLDEPFAALDDILRTKLNHMVLQLWTSKPRTILFVTHNIAEAVMLAHKIAVVASGKIAALMSNDLSWPRTPDQRTSLQFAEKYSEVSRLMAQFSSSSESK